MVAEDVRRMQHRFPCLLMRSPKADLGGGDAAWQITSVQHVMGEHGSDGRIIPVLMTDTWCGRDCKDGSV